MIEKELVNSLNDHLTTEQSPKRLQLVSKQDEEGKSSWCWTESSQKVAAVSCLPVQANSSLLLDYFFLSKRSWVQNMAAVQKRGAREKSEGELSLVSHLFRFTSCCSRTAALQTLKFRRFPLKCLGKSLQSFSLSSHPCSFKFQLMFDGIFMISCLFCKFNGDIKT